MGRKTVSAEKISDTCFEGLCLDFVVEKAGGDVFQHLVDMCCGEGAERFAIEQGLGSVLLG